ncbi:hypothetical protein FIBSPDRAFT_951780 [Athelia psychrophila]|uniref:CCHC-type domain-containing protein n=1 Tax=Athelia psychrophila TaxID=1759441 RepID=A0A166M1X6_9AGAM|nr:hypothetical protein FIBSPDRAFT_951780 [Fibularhizoctonia sp. CBS 109695]
MAARLPLDFPFLNGETDDDEDGKTPLHPQIWLRKMERFWDSTTDDKTKVGHITNALEPGSVAEEWWLDVAATDRDTYDKALALFKNRWPTRKKTATSTPIQRVALRNLKLTEEELGEWVGTGKKRTYSHVVWVDKVEGMWKELNDPAGHLLDDIRHNMPQALLDCLALKAEDEYKGEEFFEAIRLVPIDRVVRKAKADAQLRSVVELMANMGGPPPTQAPAPTTPFYPSVTPHNPYYPPAQQTPAQQQQQQMPPVTPTPRYVAPFRRELPAHHQGPTTPPGYRQLPTPSASSPNPFGDMTTPRQSNFYNQVLQAPASPLEGRDTRQGSAQLAKHAADNSVPFTDDEAGHAAYLRAITAFDQANGADGMATFTSTALLPLSPGTSRLATRECYTCGKSSQPPHIGNDCNDPNKIPIRESQWRSYINRYMNPTGQRGTPTAARRYNPQPAIIAQINVTDDGVEFDTGVYPADQLHFSDGSHSGNGQESRR